MSSHERVRAKRWRESTIPRTRMIGLATPEMVPKPGEVWSPPQTYQLRALLRGEKQRLFAGLEQFVNLGDNLEALRSFRLQCPDFWPLDVVRDTPNGLRFIGLSDELHPAVLGFRDLLRIVWRGEADDTPRALDTLLGLNAIIVEDWLSLYAADPRITLLLPESALRAMEAAKPFRILYSEIHARWGSWASGEFVFTPQCKFHEAVWLLWRERWRARVCSQCDHCFIAWKPASRYCSTRCYGKAKRKRDLKWWNKPGGGAAKRRQKRKAAQSGKKSQRKRGK